MHNNCIIFYQGYLLYIMQITLICCRNIKQKYKIFDKLFYVIHKKINEMMS